MEVAKYTSKEVVLAQDKTLTREEHNDVVLSDSKIVVKDTQARAVFGADIINRISDMEAIGIKLNGMESTITQLTDFEASMNETLSTLQTNIESDYDFKDQQISDSMISYTDTSIAGEANARALSEQQLKADFQSADNTLQANIDTVSTAISNESLSRATQIAALDTAYKSADGALSASLIQYTDDSVSTESSARASAISTLVADYNSTVARLDTVETVANNAEGFSASATKLITAPDGSITGFRFADGTYEDSVFKIFADKFQLSNGTDTDTPFEIDVSSGKTVFKGVVDFTNTDMTSYDNENASGTTPDEVVNEINNGNTTTIDGGRINTENLTVENIDIKSSETGARMEMTNSYIKVYDTSGALRVTIGELS